MKIWAVGILNQIFIKDSYIQIKFSKKEVVSGKNPFFVTSPFYTPHSICLNIGFWRGSFVWNVVLSFVVLWTKKYYSRFSRKVLVIQETCFKVKVLKTSKIPSDSHIPADTDAFKTSSGRLKKVTTPYDQTRRLHDVWIKTSDLRRLEDVWLTSTWRRPIYDVLKTSDLWLLQDAWFTTSWRRPI